MGYSVIGTKFVVKDDATRGIRSIDSQLHSLARTARTVGASFGLYLGVDAIVRGLGSVKNAARDAVESENLFSVSLGRNADAARAWSKSYSAALNLNQYETRRTLATFYTMLDSMDLVDADALSMSKNLTSLANDMASFYNLRTDDAFRKLQAGITGEIEPLKRLGIVVNDTTIKNYAMEKGWIAQGEALTETQKIYARYNVIAEATAKAQGDMLRTIDDAANVERQAQAAWQESKIIIGQSLLPAYGAAAKGLRDWLNKSKDDIKSWASDFAEGIGIVIDAMHRLNTQNKSFRERFEKLPTAMQKSMSAAYESQTGQRMGYGQVPVGGAYGVPVGTKTTFFQPDDMGYANAMLAAYERQATNRAPSPTQDLIDRAGNLGQISALTPPSGGGIAGEGMRAVVDETKTATIDVTQAMARMYDEIDSRSVESYNARLALLMKQRREYELAGVNAGALDTWYRDMMDQWRIEKNKATGGFFGGMAADLVEAQREMQTLGELGAEVGRTFRTELVGGLNDVLWRTRDLDDAWRSVLQTAGMALTQGLINQAVTPLSAGASNWLGSFFHSGGIVGREGRQGVVSSTLFSGAPTAHGGLGPGERAIIARDDEGVFTPGQMRALGLRSRQNDSETPSLLRELIATIRSQPAAAVISDRTFEEWVASRSGHRALANVMSELG